MPGLGALSGNAPEAEAQAARRTSAGAVVARELSRNEFTGLDANAAANLARESFPTLIAQPAGGPPPVPSGQRITGFSSDYVAEVASGKGGHAVVESLQPIALPTAGGHHAPINLALVQHGASFSPTFSPEGVRIGRRLGEGTSLTRAGVSLTPVDQNGTPLQSSPGTVDGASVFYAGSGRNTDSAVRPTTFGFDETTVLRSSESPEMLSFRIGTPAGATITQAPNKEIQLRDEGALIAAIAKPAAADATGTEVPVSMTLTGHVLTLVVAHHSGEYQYPVEVDPEPSDVQIITEGSRKSNWHESWSGYPQGQGNWVFTENLGERFLEDYRIRDHARGEWAAFGYQTQGNSRIYQASLEIRGSVLNPLSEGTEAVNNLYIQNTHGEFEPREELPGFLERTTRTLNSGRPLCEGGQGECEFRYGYYKHNAVVYQQAFTSSGRDTVDGRLFNAAIYIEEPSKPGIGLGGGLCLICFGAGSGNVGHVPNEPGNAETFEIVSFWCSILCPGGQVPASPKNGSPAFSVSPHNEGIGIYKAKLTSPQELPGQNPWREWSTPLEGCEGAQCPEYAIVNFPLYTKASGSGCPSGEASCHKSWLPEGEDTLTAEGKNATGATASVSGKVIVDEKPPTLGALSGLPAGNQIGESTYHLQVEASDPSGNNGHESVISSGVRSIAITVDGRQVGTPNGSCKPGPCSAKAFFTLHGAEYVPGEHILKVIATDRAGNVGIQEYALRVHAATPVSFGPGTLNPQSGNFRLASSDVLLGAGLEVVRAYNSRRVHAGSSGPLGPQWTTSLTGSESVSQLSSGNLILTGADGSQTTFTPKVKPEQPLTPQTAQTQTGAFESPQGDSNLALSKVPGKGSLSEVLLQDSAAGTSMRFAIPNGYIPVAPSFVGRVGSEGSGGEQFKYPEAVAKATTHSPYLKSGNVWVTDRENHRVADLTPAGKVIEVAGWGVQDGKEQFETCATSCQAGIVGTTNVGMIAPTGIAVNPTTGNIYVADAGGSRVFELSEFGSYVRTFSTHGSGYVAGVTVDPQGHVWACVDSRNAPPLSPPSTVTVSNPAPSHIEQFTESGEYLSSITGGGGGVNFTEPKDIAFSGGNLYVTEAEGGRVQEISPSGTSVAVFGAPGSANGKFSSPSSIAASPTTGNLFVVDTGNARVQEFTPQGVFVTKFGYAGTAAGQFGYPEGITFGLYGAVYVVDSSHNQLDQWEIAETPVTVGTWMPVHGEGPSLANRRTYEWQAAEVEGQQVLEPKLVVAPEASGVSCFKKEENGEEKPNLVQGCRALTFNYAEHTGATGEGPTEWGEFIRRLSGVTYHAWSRSENKMTEVAVAQYGYDSQGRLRAEWDPRAEPALKTTYGYDAEGHITAATPPGQQPWLIAYGTTPAGEEATLRAIKVARAPVSTPPWNGALPVSTQAPALTGSAIVGFRMGTTGGTFTGALARSYQWEDCNGAGLECAPIVGATNSNYTPIGSDGGHTLVVQVTATNNGGSVVATSAPSAAVARGVVPIYGSASFGSQGSGNGQFSSPQSIARTSTGNFWIADTANNRVELVKENGEFIRAITTWKVKVGSSEVEYAIKEPRGITVDSHNNVWIAEMGNARVDEFKESGEFVTLFHPQNSSNESISAPTAVAINNTNGNVYVTESGRLWQFNEKFEYVRALSVPSCGIFNANNGVITPCGPEHPMGLAVDSKGHVWVADQGARCETCSWQSPGVEEFSESGEFLRQSRTEHSYGAEPGQFKLPQGIAVDSRGNVWVTDIGNHRVEVLNEGAEYVTQFGTQGGGAGQMQEPSGVAVDGQGNGWVLDAQNVSVQKWVPGPPPSEASLLPAEPGSAVEYGVPVSTPAAASIKLTNEYGGFPFKTKVEQGKESTFPIPGEEKTFSIGPLAVNGSVGETANLNLYTRPGFTEERTSEHPRFKPTTEGIQSEVTGYNAKEEQVVGPLKVSCTPPPDVVLAEVPVSSSPSLGQRQYTTSFNAQCVLAPEVLNEPGTAKVTLTSLGPESVAPGQEVQFTNARFSVTIPLEWSNQLYASGGRTASGRSSSVVTASIGNLAPYGMGASEVGTWGQRDIPSVGTAVFPQEEPQSYPATTYKRATVYYADGQGRTVNVASPGGGIVTTEYNGTNEVTRTLTATNREKALKEARPAEAAEHLSTISTYNGERSGEGAVAEPGAELLESLGPEHKVKIASGPEAGKELAARAHAAYSYNEGAPRQGGPYHLATKVTQAARLANGEEADLHETLKFYSGQEGLGWKLRAPTATIVDPRGLHLRTETVYDPTTGYVVETRAPGALSSSLWHVLYASSFGRHGTANGELNSQASIAVGPNGNLWVADTYNARVQEFSPAGSFITKFGSSGTGNGQFSEPKGIAVNSKGLVWVADQNNNTLQVFNEKGEFQTKVGSPGTGNGQFERPLGVAIDHNNNVWVADYGNGRLEEFNEKGEFIRTAGSKGNGVGQIKGPFQIATDNNNNVWVADYENNRVEEFNEKGEFVTQFGSSGTGNGQFSEPKGIAVDPAGNIWVGDTGNSRVQVFSPSGEYLGQFGGAGSGAGQMSAERGLAIDSKGNAWVADSGNSRVEQWVPSRTAYNKVFYASSFGHGGAGNGEFNRPEGITVGPNSNLWVADTNNHRVQEFSPTGSFITKFGSSGTGNGQFSEPKGIAVNSKGLVWVPDQGNSTLQVFNEKGEFQMKVGSKGTGNGQFERPLGVAIDHNSNVWLADYGNGRLEEFNEKGEFIRTAGSKGNGVGQIKGPFQIATDNNNNVWVADYENNRVEEFNESGEFITQFGSAGNGNGQFSEPKAISVDPAGNVWVGDTGNGRVQVFSPSGEYLGQFGTKGSGSGQLSEPRNLTVDAKGDAWITDTGNARIEEWVPAGPHDTQAIYYSAKGEASIEACRNHPEWAGLPCQVQPAEQPHNSSAPPLPVIKIVAYNGYDQPEKTEQTVGSGAEAKTRTTTTQYDKAGRVVESTTASPQGAPLPASHFEYSSETGALKKQSNSEGSLLTSFNTLGELVSYTDSYAKQTTYEYDQYGRLSKAENEKGSDTYSYDETGLLSKLEDISGSSKLTFTAAYSSGGELVSEGLPGGLVANYAYNSIGEPISLEYKKASTTWLSDAVVPSIHGQWLSQMSSLSSENYAFDNAGRLTEVRTTPKSSGACTTRTYNYDEEGNRLSLASYPAGEAGKCQSSTGATIENHAYDEANRLVDGGMAYNLFGDIEKLAATDAGGQELTSSFFSDDQLQRQVQKIKGHEEPESIEYQLDPALRNRLATSAGPITATEEKHYSSASSEPAWTSEPNTQYTRMIPGLAGGLAAVQHSNEEPVLQLANLHGDVVATAPSAESSTKPSSETETSEFGVPTTESPPKYSWLGSHEVPTQLPSGVLDMGVRSYVPQLGRFLQPDPVPGGSANAYAYVFGNPLNQSDPSGALTFGFSPEVQAGAERSAQISVEVQIAREEALRREAEQRAREAEEAAAAATGASSGGAEVVAEEEGEEEFEEEEVALHHHGGQQRGALLEEGVLFSQLTPGGTMQHVCGGDPAGARCIVKFVSSRHSSSHKPKYRYVNKQVLACAEVTESWYNNSKGEFVYGVTSWHQIKCPPRASGGILSFVFKYVCKYAFTGAGAVAGFAITGGSGPAAAAGTAIGGAIGYDIGAAVCH